MKSLTRLMEWVRKKIRNRKKLPAWIRLIKTSHFVFKEYFDFFEKDLLSIFHVLSLVDWNKGKESMRARFKSVFLDARARTQMKNKTPQKIEKGKAKLCVEWISTANRFWGSFLDFFFFVQMNFLDSFSAFVCLLESNFDFSNRDWQLIDLSYSRIVRET